MLIMPQRRAAQGDRLRHRQSHQRGAYDPRSSRAPADDRHAAYMSPEQAELSWLTSTHQRHLLLGVLLYDCSQARRRSTTKSLRARATRDDADHPRGRAAQASTRLSSSARPAPLAQQRQAAIQKTSQTLKGDLDWIVMKCLEDRTRRYETANGLAADLQRHLSDGR